MHFTSLNFFIFLIIILIIIRGVLSSWETRKNILLFSSYFFYMSWDWRFGGLLLFLTVINFISGQKLYSATTDIKKRFYLAVSLVASLGVLAYFKYANFFIESFSDFLAVLGLQANIPLLNVILPVGISFYTFQSITYTLDIHRGKLEPVNSFRDFALFVSFFPQLVAGPIVRASFFIPQLNSNRDAPQDSIESGLGLVIRGFIKKVAFADVLAVQLVDPAFATPTEYSPIFLLIALYAYSFQVYMDFSGYTDIARGAARMMGYELPINFNRPYLAPTVSNFWQRWHISMSSFFREYLFYGLGGSKYGNVYVNLFITFVAIGIWHGAGWNFVLYGVIHASMVCWERRRRERRKAQGLTPVEYHGWYLIFKIFIIFHFVTLARILFRGGSVQGALVYADAMTNISQTNTPVGWIGGLVLIGATLFHFTPPSWSEASIRFFERLPTLAQAAAIVVTIYTLVIVSTEQAPFVYFQF